MRLMTILLSFFNLHKTKCGLFCTVIPQWVVSLYCYVRLKIKSRPGRVGHIVVSPVVDREHILA